MTYVRPNIYINKHTSPIFNCVTPESVSLASFVANKTKKFMCLGLLQLAWTRHSLFGRSISLFYQDGLPTYVTSDMGKNRGRMFHINK